MLKFVEKFFLTIFILGITFIIFKIIFFDLIFKTFID